MAKLSVIVPSYKDPFLSRTVDSILKTARGEIEVIPVLDGYKDDTLSTDSRVKTISLDNNVGMRGAINAGLERASGDYIMKCDSHCAFEHGFDVELTSVCQENWLCIPRRFSLNEDTFSRDENRPIRDYHYFGFPTPVVNYGCGLHPQEWKQRTVERLSIPIDDTMAFQGSCWLANRQYFNAKVGKLDDSPNHYGTFAQEPTEIGLKYWLGGGEIKVVKTTGYAHLSKRKKHYDSGIFFKAYKTSGCIQAGHTWSAKHWMNNEEPNMLHPFSWLVEKFWPIPTWDINWQEKWNDATMRDCGKVRDR